jgi:hypothetical protein
MHPLPQTQGNKKVYKLSGERRAPKRNPENKTKQNFNNTFR